LGDIQDEIAALSAGGGSLAMTTKGTWSTSPKPRATQPVRKLTEKTKEFHPHNGTPSNPTSKIPFTAILYLE
jgi:hypothetical protein